MVMDTSKSVRETWTVVEFVFLNNKRTSVLHLTSELYQDVQGNKCSPQVPIADTRQDVGASVFDGILILALVPGQHQRHQMLAKIIQTATEDFFRRRVEHAPHGQYAVWLL